MCKDYNELVGIMIFANDQQKQVVHLQPATIQMYDDIMYNQRINILITLNLDDTRR